MNGFGPQTLYNYYYFLIFRIDINVKAESVFKPGLMVFEEKVAAGKLMLGDLASLLTGFSLQ